MILKVELLKCEEGWRFIANVCNLESRGYTSKNPDGAEYYERELLIFKNDVCNEKITVSGNQRVFLCNDEGKTIEKIN